jgi:hypothetical protein
VSNRNFRGTVVQIDSLTLTAGPAGAPVLKASVQFASDDGAVHAVASHSFLIDRETNTDGLAPAVAELIRLVTKKVESLHYEQPNESEDEVVVGIVEALKAKTAESPDEPGPQG